MDDDTTLANRGTPPDGEKPLPEAATDQWVPTLAPPTPPLLLQPSAGDTASQPTVEEPTYAVRWAITETHLDDDPADADFTLTLETEAGQEVRIPLIDELLLSIGQLATERELELELEDSYDGGRYRGLVDGAIRSTGWVQVDRLWSAATLTQKILAVAVILLLISLIAVLT